MKKEILRAKSGYLYLKIIHNGKTEIIFETQQDLIDEIFDLLGQNLYHAGINDLYSSINKSNFNLIDEARINVEQEEQWHEAFNYEPRWDGQEL